MYGSISRTYIKILTLSMFATFIVSLLDGIVALSGVMLVPSSGLAVPLAILFGIPAGLGVAWGVLLISAISVDIGILSLIYGASVFILSYYSNIFFKWRKSYVDVAQGASLRLIGELIFTIVIASIVAATFLAFGMEFTGTSAFYISATHLFAEFLLSSLFVLPIIGILVVFRGSSSMMDETSNNSFTSSRITNWALIFVPIVWVLFGIMGSIGFRIRERVPLSEFQDRNVDLLYHYIHPDIFGLGGRRAQVVFGIIMIAALVISVQHHRNSIRGDQ